MCAIVYFTSTKSQFVNALIEIELIPLDRREHQKVQLIAAMRTEKIRHVQRVSVIVGVRRAARILGKCTDGRQCIP